MASGLKLCALFCHQMLLLVFRRELKWEDTFVCWEALWASEQLARAALRTHAAAALFSSHRRRILKMESLEDLVTFVNNLPAPIDPLDLVSDAYEVWCYINTRKASAKCGCSSLCGKPPKH